jgi:hypothetical protein
MQILMGAKAGQAGGVATNASGARRVEDEAPC